MKERIISIDIGTTYIKVVKLKHGKRYYEENRRSDIEEIVKRAVEKDYDRILLTGSGASVIIGDSINNGDDCIPITRLNELECVGHVIPEMSYDKGLVVNMGTGTSFLYYEDGYCKHVTGTGLGGGTFEGLSQRLLNLEDTRDVEKLALEGDLSKVNIVMSDIYNEKLGWLQDDITVSNFAKNGNKDEDVAIGIHSAVIEPIMSMLKAMLYFEEIEHVVFTGGVMNNNCMHDLAVKYARLFHINYERYPLPSFATAIGAIERYKKMKEDNEL